MKYMKLLKQKTGKCLLLLAVLLVLSAVIVCLFTFKSRKNKENPTSSPSSAPSAASSPNKTSSDVSVSAPGSVLTESETATPTPTLSIPASLTPTAAPTLQSAVPQTTPAQTPTMRPPSPQASSQAPSPTFEPSYVPTASAPSPVSTPSAGITEAPAHSDKPGNTTGKSVEQIIEEMTLHEKICQMFICTPEGLTGQGTVTKSDEKLKKKLSEYPIGGLVYFAQNLETVPQTKSMLSNALNYSKELYGIPLFLAVDEEGGAVARCAKKLGTSKLSPMFEYKNSGTKTAYNNALTIARDIASLGFNLDFAPVADTWSNKENTVIGKRAYSDSFSETASLVASAVKGFKAGGVSCTLKHFPGHGDTAEDSHYGNAYSSKTLKQLASEEYLAFESGINAGADMVMVGHITMTNVDDLPASVSSVMINDELRGKLGYNGAVITDSLSMNAVTGLYSSETLAVKAVQAGCDILLMPENLSEAVAGLEDAVISGEISEDRIDESVERILKIKAENIGF